MDDVGSAISLRDNSLFEEELLKSPKQVNLKIEVLPKWLRSRSLITLRRTASF